MWECLGGRRDEDGGEGGSGWRQGRAGRGGGGGRTGGPHERRSEFGGSQQQRGGGGGGFRGRSFRSSASGRLSYCSSSYQDRRARISDSWQRIEQGDYFQRSCVISGSDVQDRRGRGYALQSSESALQISFPQSLPYVQYTRYQF